MNSGAPSLAVSDLMRQLSAHLDCLAAEVHEIEYAIGKEPENDSSFDNDQIKRLQRLDFLRQSLEDLALLNHFLADHVTGEIPHSLENRLRLEATRALFKPDQTKLDIALASRTLGDVDLF